ncbi:MULTISPECIES: exodeoxyribonuclease VII large subunit [Legionella]|uniref:Exodeoxyribonuclease 7 large subunit n=1 Tax=Legionella maceachernii TaxID=466 RepID=A0A0W0VXQ6_9GAMM|nr:exodeoxyribonuclease VII large subunit [Legionella maceachernii]KTD24933.1 exonuclease VII large subunit [Legionella maceachernii]SKA16572.1 Exodeoxyribonuclease VII large subunit [Legionella maceachernii]SUP01673.1 Exodeoxyribonuclease 7 large subunit [Legionella maceachernii]
MQPDQNTLTVTQLNRQIRSWLEIELGQVAVIGEISNLSKPTSGHFYFTLKDSTAQLRCVYFRNHHDATSKNFKDGQQVIATGKLSLYEARGEYQLIVHALSEAGLGELYRQFEQLKIKLQTQGLFDQSRKKKLPLFPSIIGVVTSPSAAALRDILTTLKRRFPFAAVRIYASEVQGREAPQQLIRAVQKANQENLADVLILARGGGSIEDLWAFNDEQLALTISNSVIPIVTGVGHETDFTIADFVADLRAPTPTAAAEAVTPHQTDLINTFFALEKRLLRAIHQFIDHKQLVLAHQIAKFLSPAQLIATHWQTIDSLEQQLNHRMQGFLHQQHKKLHLFQSRLHAKNPMAILQQSKAKVQRLEQQLYQTLLNKFNRMKQKLTMQMATLHAVSPLATLDRGYALATYRNSVLFDSQQVNLGDAINVRLARGNLLCQVVEKEALLEAENSLLQPEATII